MTKKIVIGAMIVALTAVVATPSASAACGSPRTASTFGSGTTAYWLPAGGATIPSLQTWQLGNPGTWSGSLATGCLDNQLFQDVGGWSLFYNISGCGAGCPASFSTLATLAQVKGTVDTSFLLDTVVETPAVANNFDYGPQGNHQMISIPRPRVTASARVGTTVNVSVGIDSIAAGLFGPNAASAVTGFKVLSAQNATDPGRDAAAYTEVANLPAAGGAAAASGNIALDCTSTTERWLVTQIVFEGGVITSNAVGAPTRVHCDPALANPGKYKIVPKKLAAPTRDAQ